MKKIDFEQCSKAAKSYGAYFVDEDYAAFTGHVTAVNYATWLASTFGVIVQMWFKDVWSVRIDPESL